MTVTVYSDPHGEFRPAYAVAITGAVIWTNRSDEGQVRIVFGTDMSGDVARNTLALGGVPSAITYDGSRYVYYFDSSKQAIFKLDTHNYFTTAPTPPTLVLSGIGMVMQMASDGTNLYWADLLNGQVMKWALSGASNPVALASRLTNPFGLAIDGSNVYYSLNTPTGSGPSVFSVPIGGGGSTTLVSDTDGALYLVVSGGDLFWSEQGGNIVKCVISGPTVSNLVTGVPTPAKVATDGTNIYYVSRGSQGGSFEDGYVSYVPIAGGSPTSLATGLLKPLDVIYDDGDVFWTAEGVDQFTGSVAGVVV